MKYYGKINEAEKAILREELGKTWRNGKDIDWKIKRASCFCDFGDIIVIIDKPYIKTDFWFGEHGFDYDEVTEKCRKASDNEQYFVNSNMRGTEAWCQIAKITGEKYTSLTHLFVCKNGSSEKYKNDRTGYIQFGDCLGRDCYGHAIDGRELSEEEKAQYIEALKSEQDKFQKRLSTYLKRYGLSKCNFSTFWADR